MKRRLRGPDRLSPSTVAILGLTLMLVLCLVGVLVFGCASPNQAASTTSQTYALGGLDPALAQLIDEARAAGLRMGAAATSQGELTLDVLTQPDQPVGDYESIAQKLLLLAQKFKDRFTQFSPKVDLLHVRVAWADTPQHSTALYDRYFQLTMPARVNTPVNISLSLVAANTIKFGEIWVRVAQAGGFAAESAYPDAYPTGLDLDFTPSGSLFQLEIVARTHDQRTISVAWSGSDGAADQRVLVTGVVKTGSATEPIVTLDSVSRVAAAFDEVGVKSMIALMPTVHLGGYYALRPVLHAGSTRGGSIPAMVTAYLWDSTKLVPLDANDPIRIGNAPYLMLELSWVGPGVQPPGTAVAPMPPALPSPVFFAIPVPVL